MKYQCIFKWCTTFANNSSFFNRCQKDDNFFSADFLHNNKAINITHYKKNMLCYNQTTGRAQHAAEVGNTYFMGLMGCGFIALINKLIELCQIGLLGFYSY